MDRNQARHLPAATMRAGIIIGAVGAFSVILAPQLLQSLQFGPSYSQALGALFSVVFQLVTLFFLPFSAALIAASLVMRHLNSALAGATATPVERPPAEE